MKSLCVMTFVVCVGSTWAQCSLVECERTQELGKQDRLGSLVFQVPEKKWRLKPELRVERVATQEDGFWLVDSRSEKYFPPLQFVSPRTEISARMLIYRSKGLDGGATEVTLGLHRRPKGFGLVWRRSFY